MSRHAVERAVDMAITADEIRDAFERPREKHFQERTRSWIYTRGRVTLCIVINPEPIVTTVLWARTSDWVADRQFGKLVGREHEDDSGIRRVAKARKRR
jgi:hypothetical protein